MHSSRPSGSTRPERYSEVTPIKILIAKAGLDGHDRGAKIVARALRDAGMEVIYLGPHTTPEMVVTVAIQEDVDVLGLSSLSGAHMTTFPKMMHLLNERGAGDIIVIGGGVIVPNDVPKLEAIGIRKIFDATATTADLITGIQAVVAQYGRGKVIAAT
jgi:methylmalonyl-CoA mutase, C-terminal domain